MYIRFLWALAYLFCASVTNQKSVLYDGHQRREEVDVVGDVVTQDVGEATVVGHVRLFLLAHFERPDLN